MIEDGSATFVRCSISRTEVTTFGGLGGGIAIRNGSGQDQFLRVEDSLIEDNSAGAGGLGYGGAIAAQFLDTEEAGISGVFLDRVRLAGNRAELAGGALDVEDTPFEVNGSLFSGNQGDAGNSIHASGESRGIVRGSTLLGAGTGSAIRSAARLEVVNSIVRGNAAGIEYAGPAGGLEVGSSAFSSNGADVAASGFALDASNLLVDPQLDATGHLLPGSPLIDAGRRTSGPSLDIDGDPRPAAGPSGRFALDIGADEAPGESQRRFDVARGEYDLAIVGPGAPPENPGASGSGESIGSALLGADWSGDGRDDLLIFGEAWGRGFGLLNFGARISGALDLLLDTGEDLQIRGEPGSLLGSGLASGDLDGDALPDLALRSASGVFALRGGPALSGIRSIPPADLGLVAAGLDSVAIGDLSGDGIGDLVAAGAGSVSVIFGGALPRAGPDLTIHASGSGFGSALALADLDLDGDLDLAVSGAADTHVLLGPLAAGIRDLSTAPADVQIANLGGSNLIALDLSGEGRPDLLAGHDSLRLVRGPFAAGQVLDAGSAASLAPAPGGAFGALAAGDVLGDARPELIAAQPGTAWVISSGVSGAAVTPVDEIASLAVAIDASAVAAADLDLDGRADLIVSDPGAGPLQPHPPGAQDAGRIYLFYGGLAADNCPGLSNPDQADGDADGAGDACDRCPLHPDPVQRDLGRVASPADPAGAESDGTGDACQCGDVTGDGRGNAADLAALRGALAGSAPLETPQKCNVRDPGDCSLVDAAVLARQLAGLAPGVGQLCAPALGSAAAPD
jgi:hypothetical protein